MKTHTLDLGYLTHEAVEGELSVQIRVLRHATWVRGTLLTVCTTYQSMNSPAL